MSITTSMQSKYWEAALRAAPALYLDKLEPFLPIRVGITIFENSAQSHSVNRMIHVNREKVQFVVEYAIYWDYDIEHLYDLEHVWVYIGHQGEIVSSEASFHGHYFLSLLSDRSNITADNRVKLFVQPGKHALMPLEEVFRLLPNVEICCNEEAGNGGLLEPEMFKGQFKLGADDDKLSETHLRTFSFQPSFEYVPYEWGSDIFVGWEELRAEIPVRLKKLLANLRAATP
jgi:hypothetical protein